MGRWNDDHDEYQWYNPFDWFGNHDEESRFKDEEENARAREQVAAYEAEQARLDAERDAERARRRAERNAERAGRDAEQAREESRREEINQRDSRTSETSGSSRGQSSVSQPSYGGGSQTIANASIEELQAKILEVRGMEGGAKLDIGFWEKLQRGNKVRYPRKLEGEAYRSALVQQLARDLGLSASETNKLIKDHPYATLDGVISFATEAAELIDSETFDGSENEAFDLLISQGRLNDPDSFKKVTNEIIQSSSDSGSALTLEEAKRVSQGLTTTSVDSKKLQQEAIERARETYERAYETQDEMDERAEEFFDDAENLRDRQHSFEDQALRNIEERAAEEREQRQVAIRNYEASREQALNDRQSRIGLINEIRNAPSTFEEAQRQAHEQSLKNQASLAAVLPTKGGGGVINRLLDQQREQDLNIAQGSSVGRLQEAEGRRSQIAGLLGQNQQAAAIQQGQDLSLGQFNLQALGQDRANEALRLGIAQNAGAGALQDRQAALSSLQLGLSAVHGSSGVGNNALGRYLDTRRFLNEDEKHQFDMAFAPYDKGLGYAEKGAGVLSDVIGAIAKLKGGAGAAGGSGGK